MRASGYLLASVFATAFANGGARVTLTWLVLQKFGATALSMIVVALAVAQFSGSFVAGHFTDRYEKKKIAVITNTLCAIAILMVAGVLSDSTSSAMMIGSFACAANVALVTCND